MKRKNTRSSCGFRNMKMRDLILGLIGFMALMLWVMFWGPVFVVRDCWRYLQTGNWYEL